MFYHNEIDEGGGKKKKTINSYTTFVTVVHDLKDRVSRMLWKVRSTSFVCNLYVGWRGDIHQLVEVLTVSLRLDVQ